MENRYDYKYKYLLKPEYDGALSFYHKACYYEWYDEENKFATYELFSYDTKVLYIRLDEDKNIMLVRVYGGENYENLSNTTCRHIREALRQVAEIGDLKFPKSELKTLCDKYTKYKINYGSLLKIGQIDIE